MQDESPPATRRRAVLLSAAAALVAALVVAVVWVMGKHDSPQQVAASQLAPARPAATRASSTPARPTSASAPAPAPTKKAPPHDYVAAAAPSAFSFAGKGITIKARVCGMEYVRPFDPPGEQHHTVCWVQHDFGFAPGSEARGTTYVLGHSWGQDQLEVLNKISETAMRQVLPLRKHSRTTELNGIPTYPVTRLTGSVISLRTPNGVLRYTVRNAYAVAKEQAGNVKALMAEHTRNRVVIITCGELNHVDYDYNIIVEGYLTSSVATGSTA